MPLNSAQIEESFSTTDEDIKILLSNIWNLNLQYNSSEKIIINTINKLLSVSKTRLQGLEFLDLIINNCSKTVITENALTWVSHCLVKYTGDSLKEIKLSMLGKIIENAHNEQEFNRRFVSDHISKVLESCISDHVNSHETEVALQTLTICMKYYASWFTPHKEKIENFIIKFLEYSENLVDTAALAFLYLQQIGGAGPDGVNHRANFSNSLVKLCVSIHKLFDKFFENEIEIDHSDRSNEDGFTFIDLSHHSQKMLHITAKRITSCLKFLKIMILKSFPVAKEVKPMDLLNIVRRGTAIHSCLSMDKEKSLEDFQFALLLNKVQIELLQLLRIFIIWLQENSLPFSFVISKILIDCLNKIQNCQCFTTDSLYQEVVYKVLGCWLRVSKNSFHAHFQTQLVTCVMKDITPIRKSVTLSLQTDSKNKSLKARRKNIQERIISSGQGNNFERLTGLEKVNNERNCLFALGALRELLLAATLRLKPNILQDLYTCIIHTILDIQTSKYSHPYTNNDCQAKLYEVLVAFYEQETLKVLPPLQLTIDVLNKGSSNKNRHIALTCEHGLSIVEKLCQPVCPSLFMPEVNVAEKTVDKPNVLFDNQVLDDIINNVNGNEDGKDDMPEDVEISNENGTSTEYEREIIEEEAMEETNIEIEAEVSQEQMAGENADTEEAQSEAEEVPTQTLLREKSIHIIDIQVISNLENDVRLIQNDSGERAPTPSESFKEDKVSDDSITTEVNILKKEIISNMSMSSTDLLKSQEDIKGFISGQNENEDEPPVKKPKTELETDVTEEYIKEEVKSFEEVDDAFEEDGAFVDEVKEY